MNFKQYNQIQEAVTENKGVFTIFRGLEECLKIEFQKFLWNVRNNGKNSRLTNKCRNSSS